MYLLYPRLPLAVADNLVLERNGLAVSELVQISNIHHETVKYYETGSKIPSKDLGKLQNSIRTCAKQYGYPDPANEKDVRAFDIACGELLHQTMQLHPSEASHLEMWVFLTCVLLPDVVRWRFPGNVTTPERFIGSDRGLRRNTFGRLWWRAYLLHQPGLENPYKFFDLLHEDDLVQITERNSIAASQILITVFIQAFIEAVTKYDDIPRRDIMRETIKRVRRLLSFIAFDLLSEEQIRTLIDEQFEQTLLSTNKLRDAK